MWIPNYNRGTRLLCLTLAFTSLLPTTSYLLLPLPERKVTGLFFSEDTQLDIHFSLENNIPASTGGRGRDRKETAP